MAREEQAIFTNLCMITDGKGNVLVEDRKDPSCTLCIKILP